MARAARGSDQFPLRLPEGLRDIIKVAAEKNGRSMNTEIVERLDHSFHRGPEQLADLLKLVHDQDTELRELRKFADERKILLDQLSKTRDALNEQVSLSRSLQVALDASTQQQLGSPPLTSELFDELFGGSRLAKQVEKMREDLAKTIEEVQRRRMTEEEKEDIWQWLQKKDESEKGKE